MKSREHGDIHIKEDLRDFGEAEGHLAEAGVGGFTQQALLQEVWKAVQSSSASAYLSYACVVRTDVKPRRRDDMALLLELQVCGHPYGHLALGRRTKWAICSLIQALVTCILDSKSHTYGYERGSFHSHERDDLDELLACDEFELGRCDGCS